MIQLFRMAFRDLGRNRRRSFFSALALGVGLSLLLLIACVLEGEMRSAMENTIKLESGHLQVQSGSYEPDKSSLVWEDLLEAPDQMSAQIASLPPVAYVTPRLFVNGIVTSGDKNSGVRVIGIDPASEANAPFREGIISGDFLQADDRQGLLVGERLAEKLELQTGDQVILLVNTSNGEVDEQPFVIRGVFSTGVPGYDENSIFMPLAKAQAMTQTENHASILFVMLKDQEQAFPVAGAIQAGAYKIKTWQELNVLIIETEKFANSYMSLVYLIVLAITATVIINTLIMAVFERTREIGILAAVGMRSGRIMAMFFAESTLLAIGGILIGLALGSIWVYLAENVGIYIGDMGMTGILMGERVYGHLLISDAISLTIMTFIVTLLAALYPALLAARMEPVDALRGGK
jgi:ABC-type lipoprotein release transport system permease subunit